MFTMFVSSLETGWKSPDARKLGESNFPKINFGTLSPQADFTRCAGAGLPMRRPGSTARRQFVAHAPGRRHGKWIVPFAGICPRKGQRQS
jgi:hypothetical protein